MRQSSIGKINNKKSNVLFVGNIQSNQKPDGGGVQFRNQITIRYLKQHFNVKAIDTWNKAHLYALLITLVNTILYRNNLIVLSISIRAVYALMKILSLIRIKTKKVIFFMPGGEGADKNEYLIPKRINKLNGISEIYDQSYKVVQKLRTKGLSNVYHCYNFKEVKKLQSNLLFREFNSNIVRFVYIGRLIPEKGIDIIVSSCKKLTEMGVENFQVTIFGKSNHVYNDNYLHSLENFNIYYKGFLDMSRTESYNILQNNDVLLFPSFFKGEGFPGVLIDAFICGMPVVATKHNMNDEIIENNKNGLLIDKNSPQSLVDAMLLLIRNKTLLNSMKFNAYIYAHRFDTQSVLDPIFYKYF